MVTSFPASSSSFLPLVEFPNELLREIARRLDNVKTRKRDRKGRQIAQARISARPRANVFDVCKPNHPLKLCISSFSHLAPCPSTRQPLSSRINSLTRLWLRPIISLALHSHTPPSHNTYTVEPGTGSVFPALSFLACTLTNPPQNSHPNTPLLPPQTSR